jgi:hypothetical protein
MKKAVRRPLSTLIALTLCVAAGAQEEDDVKPGLYTTVDQDEIYLIIGDEQYDLKTGESAFVDGDELQFVSRPPAFLNWPCGTSFAGQRGSLATYPIDDLPPEGRVQEIIRLFFEDKEIPDTTPRWMNGETHGSFPAADIEAMVTDSYWYVGGPPDSRMAAQRPDTLLISVYRGTGQAVVDTNFLAELKRTYPDGNIPVVFDFAEEHEVPISYFGRNPSLNDLAQAFSERGVTPDDVPMFFAGDKHLEVDPGELADALGARPASEIDPDRMASLQADLQAHGFGSKPITLSMTPGSEAMVADEADRIRAAEALGMSSVPVMFSFYTDSSHASHCGLPPMIAAVGTLGTTNASNTPDAPGEVRGPDKPPEIELPDPPQVEPPASGG